MELELEYSTRLFAFFWTKPRNALVSASTIGADSPANSLNLSVLVKTKTTEENSIDYVAWDFAGQLEYSPLHPVSISKSICSNNG